MEYDMSFQERRSVMNIASTILVTAFYFAYMMQRYPQENAYSPEVFRFWGAFFLIFIPVTILARIITYIIFYIVNTIATREEESSITDERDNLIELKATRYSMIVFGLGFVLAMVSLVMGLPPSVMFIILICAGLVSEIVSEFSQFYFYRRGL
jgi:uncharacterized membrane protein